MDLDEFERSLKYLQKKNINLTLDVLGLSLGKIVISVSGIAFIMIMVLTFIFVGISAFSIGGSFGAIINSIIPIAGGAAVST